MTKCLTALAMVGALTLLGACAEESRAPFAYKVDKASAPAPDVMMSKRLLALQSGAANADAPLFDVQSDPDDFPWIDAHFPVETAMYVKGLIEIGDYELAQTVATYHTALETEHPASKAENGGVAFMLRDLTWRYGPAGAVKVLQIAVDVRVDGVYGPITRRALRRAERDPRQLIAALNAARAPYEILAGDQVDPALRSTPERAAAVAAVAEGYL